MHAQTQIGHIGAAKHDCARCLHALDGRRINGWNCLSKSGDALRGRLTCNIDIDFDGVGNAVKWTDWATLCESNVCGICCCARLIGHYSNDGVDFGVHLVDSREMCIDYFSTGKLFTANTFSKV